MKTNLAKIIIPENCLTYFTDEWITKLNNRFVFLTDKKFETPVSNKTVFGDNHILVKRHNTVFGNSFFWVPVNFLELIK